MTVDTNAAGEPLVVVERRDRVGIVRFNRPEARNAMNVELTAATGAAIDELEADDEIWALVVTGTGSAFCAGADLKAMAARQADGSRPPQPPRVNGFASITERRFRKPVIAAVNGHAMAGGTEICLSCDLIVAEEQALFGLPEVRRGLAATAGGLQRLPRRLPPNIAMELILTGGTLAADRAHAFGLVNRLVPPGGSLEAAVELASAICEAAPLSVRYSRAVVRASFTMGEDDALLGLDDLRQAMMTSEDLKEGPRAFAERRPPRWTGR